VISRQMMRWVKVEEVGDSAFLIDEVVDRFRFMSENSRAACGKHSPPSALSRSRRDAAAIRDRRGGPVARHGARDRPERSREILRFLSEP